MFMLFQNGTFSLLYCGELTLTLLRVWSFGVWSSVGRLFHCFLSVNLKTIL